MPPSPSALLSNVQDAVVLLDAAGVVVFASPSAEELIGIEPGAVGATFSLERIHPDEREAAVRSFERTIAEPGSVARATYRFASSGDGWRHLEALAKNLVADPDLQGVLLTFRDVSERIEALETARRAERSRDDFLARLSHELRTPLHAMLGWAQLLATGEDERTLEAAGQISEAGTHLLRIVDDSLDLLAVGEGRIRVDLQPVAVDSAVAESVALIGPVAAERDISIRIDPDSPGALVIADPLRLHQVLLNLIGNAVKFSRYAGEVVVGCSEASAGVRISIADSGPGISPEGMGRLFERFSRVGDPVSPVSGSGLGLWISRRLVETMGGRIGVESILGHGSTFWFELPMPDDPPALRPTAPARVVAAGTVG